jgi:hypothetical protein
VLRHFRKENRTEPLRLETAMKQFPLDLMGILELEVLDEGMTIINTEISTE